MVAGLTTLRKQKTAESSLSSLSCCWWASPPPPPPLNCFLPPPLRPEGDLLTLQWGGIHPVHGNINAPAHLPHTSEWGWNTVHWDMHSTLLGINISLHHTEVSTIHKTKLMAVYGNKRRVLARSGRWASKPKHKYKYIFVVDALQGRLCNRCYKTSRCCQAKKIEMEEKQRKIEEMGASDLIWHPFVAFLLLWRMASSKKMFSKSWM